MPGLSRPSPTRSASFRRSAALGWPMAVASSSKNANRMMQPIRLDSARACSTYSVPMSAVAICGRASQTRRFSCSPLRSCGLNPQAASSSRTRPPASRRPGGRMAALGVARLGDAALLRAAGADLVVTSLDEVAVDELVDGRLCRRPT